MSRWWADGRREDELAFRPDRGPVAAVGRRPPRRRHDPVRLTEAERDRVLGVVPQVVVLFSGTVFDNLTLGDSSVGDDAVYEAAAIAGADAFIRALPQGYHTWLSGGGSGHGAHLSAGQRQLVALARALVHRPAVVLLDEATAAIDNASDAAFRAALRERVLPRGTAVVTVAHRLTTALDADRVIVLDRGRIVEQGPPAILSASRGRFAALLEAPGRRVGSAQQCVVCRLPGSVLAIRDAGAAAHVDGLPRHEVGLVGGDEDHRPGDLLGPAQALERHLAGCLGDHLGRLPDLEHSLRLDRVRAPPR